MKVTTKAEFVSELLPLMPDKSTAGMAEKMVDTVRAATANILKQGGTTIVIPGICRIEVVDQKPRTGRNPKTGEIVQIAARKKIKMKAAPALSRIVSGEEE